MAEPLILLTGVVLWRLCRLYKKTKMYKNRRKIAATTLHKRAARAKIDFCAPGRDLASILAAPERSRVLPNAPPGVPGRSWGDSLGDPGACRGHPEMLPRCSRDAFRMLLGTTGRPEGVARSSLNRFWVLRGSSGQLPGSIWGRFLFQFSHQFRKRSGQRMISLSIVRHTSKLALGQGQKSRSAYRYGID